ncbi:hypothetical protein [Kineococcus sp. SYSU DK003]|uniref:hypothetical protein n=1 Tax=Kineococcus sp. SYSU DK003 TaxID=3383124 RepID=UPI003D7D301D
MGVDLGKDGGTGSGRERARPEPLQGPHHPGDGQVARTTPPPVPYEKREPSVPQEEPQQQPAGARGLSSHALGVLSAAWTVGWIVAFANGVWWLGVVMIMMGGPLAGYLRHQGVPWAPVDPAERARRRRLRHQRRAERHRELRSRRVPQAVAAPPATPDPVTVAERRLAAAVVTAETAGGRLEAESLELVREVDRLLRPLLAQLRTREADPQVRHDLETLAGEHLPRTLEDYLVLPDDYARQHRTSAGTTPADELRSQLQLLVEGCRQLRDSVLARDVDRQQQQSRFLEAKFRRSDLDL